MPHPAPQPRDSEDPAAQFQALWEIVRLLRRECPWDREQTHASIAPLLIEEAYESVESIRNGATDELARELGDLLLHVLMHCVIAEEEGEFRLSEVIAQESAKLVRRHPHVFGSVEANSAHQVKQRWEQLKLHEGRQSLLDGVPKSLPALLRAQRLQERAAAVGFDWTSQQDVWHKVEEELAELRAAVHSGSSSHIAEELGDILFALVNLARLVQLSAEECLQAANDKFVRRFQYMEQHARTQNTPLQTLSLTEMDVLWEQAKQRESQVPGE
ncbi:MAG: nucleoside triphosphate pyrophosphohydrolase [Candidatus Kapabacteria bacterium]|nr:nucleoside triphosphate pyrophosphohydrolase [Candidatus Kapabacteria bacterium]MCS7169454.1 nucleoside triphosphate pyrophosphohydrolase [Candidatus Kapabacteria bacterium]MDW7997721.1 nucleoside triphosphate pyrophosphohydrolase [Bacteroidota bacterium]MDW8225548.1 nucleoside triphosphate pyrophosphohydrolase [Bacteroidota bacterium]